MRGLTLRRWVRRRTRGQALVETAIAAPVLLVLMGGGLQFAYLGYGNASIDTAAREGARVAAEQPNTSLAWATGGTTQRDCTLPVSSDLNPVCQAVVNSLGVLSASKISKVTVTVTAHASFTYLPPRDLVLVSAQACANSSDADVLGNVNPVPSTALTITDTAGGATAPDAQGNFSVCIKASNFNGSNNNQVQDTITASAPCAGGGLQSGSVTVLMTQSNNGNNATYTYSVNPVTIALSACPTPTPAPTATPTPTPTPTPTSSSTPTPSSTPPPVGSPPPSSTCTNSPVAAGDYVTVHVEYQATIFIPLIGGLLGDGGGAGYRTLKSDVVMRVESCSTT